MILDGWGLGKKATSDAIKQAKTPFINSCYTQYPHSQLQASGEAVGLPEGQMGNSEVGHLTIGAGRTIYQELVRINKAVRDQSLANNPELIKALAYAKEKKHPVHLIGLVSDGGVHSHINHLKALIQIASDYGNDVYLHAFTDGRDTDPQSGIHYIKELQEFIKSHRCKIASVCGRYYAMDRDNRWERVKEAYDLLVNGHGKASHDLLKSIEESYQEHITDEFIKPVFAADETGKAIATIKDEEVVICFNFRTDRGREITQVLTQKDFHEFNMHKLNLYYLTMTNYDDQFKDVKVLFHKNDLSMTLGEVLEKHHKKQIRIAETEKYPHVTFFFSGGREKTFEAEKRILIPSPKVATYDLQPEMSAHGIAEAICKELKTQEPDFVCLNFANPDMVGHTGIFSAVVKAVETVDSCAEQVVKTGLENNYSFIIIADHGNADYMINEDGSPNTAHSLNLVPCIVIDKDVKKVDDGTLADIAPSILSIMGIEIPSLMDGKSLIG